MVDIADDLALLRLGLDPYHPLYRHFDPGSVRRVVDECERLRVERDALKADAERYRYWRSHHVGHLLEALPPSKPFDDAMEALDEVTDAAI